MCSIARGDFKDVQVSSTTTKWLIYDLNKSFVSDHEADIQCDSESENCSLTTCFVS